VLVLGLGLEQGKTREIEDGEDTDEDQDADKDDEKNDR
jgi:hypothetical protein